MVQLNIISGKKAGARWIVRHFPWRIGRSQESDLPLDDDGIWAQHLTLEFRPTEGFEVTSAANALVMVNNQPVQTALLRNGDTITLGSVKLQFWLAAVRQRGLRFHEGFIWALLAFVLLGQFALIYWLVR